MLISAVGHEQQNSRTAFQAFGSYSSLMAPPIFGR
jgi:hypothetical protein